MREKDSKLAPALENADAPKNPRQERDNASDCEDEIDDNDVDGASQDVARDSARGTPSDAESEDSVKADAQMAVASAIAKMERFQEAVQFNIVGEMYDLKRVVHDLPARGRRPHRPGSQDVDSPTAAVPPGHPPRGMWPPSPPNIVVPRARVVPTGLQLRPRSLRAVASRPVPRYPERARDRRRAGSRSSR
jgi:hypothetical protein